MENDEKMPLFTRLNDAIDGKIDAFTQYVAKAAEDKEGISDDIVRGGLRTLGFVANLPVIKQIGQLEEGLVSQVGKLAEQQDLIDPRSFTYSTRIGTAFIPYFAAAKAVGKVTKVAKKAKAIRGAKKAMQAAEAKVPSELNVRLKANIDDPKNPFDDFGPEGPRGGGTDAQIYQAYKESQGELQLNPNMLRGQEQFPVKGGEGARVNPRFDYGEDVLANTPTENVKLLADLGLDNDQAVFLLSNYDKADISRDASAAIQSLYTTVKEFNDTKDLALPYFLRGMKGIKRSKTPELDHIAQLKASLPFFNNAQVSQFPEITRIILEEGVYGLGHQRGNFKYLEFDVHTVKSNFFRNKVGDNGEIFFKDRDISTPNKLRAAAKEYAKIIDESNNVVADAIEQYKFMNKKDITEAELDEFVDILGNQPIRREYSIMQIRNIFKQMEEDGFLQTAKQSQKVEAKQIRAEQKELSRQERLKKQLDKDAASVQVRRQQMEAFLNENLDTFNVNPYPLGMKDEALREAAEDTYRLFKENQLAIEGNVQRSLFEAQERERFIKVMMKSILNRIKRDLKKNK